MRCPKRGLDQLNGPESQTVGHATSERTTFHSGISRCSDWLAWLAGLDLTVVNQLDPYP
jgi:hypothetical protein